MKKSELIRRIAEKGETGFKSWNKARLTSALEALKDRLAVSVQSEDAEPWGNWTVAKDWFPTIDIDQQTKHVSVVQFSTTGFQKRASIETDRLTVTRSADGAQIYIRGEVSCSNYKNGRCSGSQKFCFAVFVGDSGHIYTHRAPATKGWMEGNPDLIRKRLRKLGIGALEGVIQQGDHLLKPANGAAHPDNDFKHERMGSGHHNFETPVLCHRGQYFVKENTLLIHTAVDGIQHPDIIVPPGKYIVGTTANQLSHSNARD